MKKFFVCMFAVSLLATGSTLSAQEVEPTPDAQAVEPVAEAQVSDGIVVEQDASALPVADGQPIASDVIYDAGVVANGIVADGQPIQAFDSSSCCNSCCEGSSFVQPVVFNQPIIAPQTILPESITSEALPATFTAAPIAAECSSCSGAVADFTPAPVETFAPVATSFAAPVVTAPVVTQTFAPDLAPTQTFASAPAATQTFASIPAPAQTFTSAPAPTQTFVSAPVTACAVQATAPAACCQPNRATRLFRQRGLFSRLRGSAISAAIDDNN